MVEGPNETMMKKDKKVLWTCVAGYDIRGMIVGFFLHRIYCLLELINQKTIYALNSSV